MSQQTSKRNPNILILCVVLAVAVILSVVLFNQRSSLSAQVNALTSDLETSRTAWETTAAEKETLQAELTTAQNDLREAQTSLAESQAKITELEGQVTTLTADNATAAADLTTATEANAALSTEIDSLTAQKAALETSVADLTAQVETLTADLTAAQASLTAETAARETAEADLAKAQSEVADVQAVATEAPAETVAPEPAAEPAEVPAEAADAAVTVDESTVLATVNGVDILYGEVNEVAQNLIYNYSQYGYDFSDAAMVQSVYQMAMEYTIQMELLEQKAIEMGLDQMTDEEKAELEAEVAAEWENVIQGYIDCYIPLAADATDDEKAAARADALTALENMGYTEAILMETLAENAMYSKVEAEMIKGAEVSDEEVKAAFDEKAASDETKYSQDIVRYEYMTNYSGETSYYQPEGYRGITHILLEVDEELLNAYQDLTARLEEQEEAAEEAAAATEAPATTDAAESAEPTAEPTATPVPVTQADVDAAYAAAIASVQPTIDEINQKLADGVSFADLIAEYGTDPGMAQEPNKSQGYPVHKDSIMWDPAFTKAAFSVDNVGDIAEPVLGSYGVHIVQYTRDIPAGPIEMTDEIAAALHSDLLLTKEDTLYDATMTAWLSEATITYTEAGQLYVPAE